MKMTIKEAWQSREKEVKMRDSNKGDLGGGINGEGGRKEVG